MKHLKMLGLAMMAAMALAAFSGAGSASATVLCKVATNPCPLESRYPVGTAIDASLTAGTSMLLEGEFGSIDTCTGSTLSAKSTTAGSSTQTVSLAVEGWTFIACTMEAKLTSKGEMEVHWISGTNNGTLTARGVSGTAANCSWSLKEWTTIGTIKGGNPAEIELSMPITQICWWQRMTARYTVTAPKPLYVEGS